MGSTVMVTSWMEGSAGGTARSTRWKRLARRGQVVGEEDGAEVVIVFGADEGGEEER